MNKISILLVFCLAILSYTQAQTPPQAFNYSGVARDANGLPIATTTIGIQISILKTSTTGATSYSENHFVNTDVFGLFNLVVGAGAVQSGSMSTIDWSNDNYYLKVGMDATGGTSFLTMGITQLLSVPYALHASTADSLIGGGAGNGFSGNYNDLTNQPITIDSISANSLTIYLSNGQSFGGANSCSDGIMNGTETGIDCGGPCLPCVIGGLYTGNVTGPFQMVYTPVIDRDTTFLTPGTPSTYEILAHNHSDSINTKLNMTLDGTPFSINAPAYLTSDTTFTITNHSYTNLVVNMLLNGSGTVNGNNLTSNTVLTNGTGNPPSTIVNINLEFIGTK